MKNDRIGSTLLAGLLLALAAPGASSAPRTLISNGPVTAGCNSITGGKAKVSSVIEPGCARCSVKAANAAADDQAKTFASLSVLSSSVFQGVSIRATAQPGIVFPAGGRAGVFFSLPNNNPKGENLDSGGSTALGIGTYLRGQLQESAGLNTSAPLQNVSSGSYNFPGGDALPKHYTYIETTKPYDAVELYVSDTQVRVRKQGQVDVGSAPYKVYEVCSDGFVSEHPGR